MADISLVWGDDIQFDDLNDVLGVDGVEELEQRLIRGFLSLSAQAPSAKNPLGSPGDDLFDGSYGGDAGLYVDSTPTFQTIEGLKKRFLQVIANEGGVSTTTPPIVNVYQNTQGLLEADITVTMANGQVVSVLNLGVSP